MILPLLSLLAVQEPKATDPVAELLADTNRIRKSRNLAELKLNDSLVKAAQLMADDISRSGNLDHRDSQGRKLSARVDAVDYKWKRVCENLAFNFTTAGQVNSQWLLSDGHRKNLLDRTVREAGIGFAKDARNQPYWVMIYGVPLSR